MTDGAARVIELLGSQSMKQVIFLRLIRYFEHFGHVIADFLQRDLRTLAVIPRVPLPQDSG
jgi:hypothetical protein